MKDYRAGAKINLALHVTDRLDNGFHSLDTLVTFAEYGDVVGVEPADDLSLSINGPFAATLQNGDNNLVLTAARLLQQASVDLGYKPSGAAIHLEKQLPIASGIGGGSADAAATLIALCELWALDPGAIDLHKIAVQLGADVPMCLLSRPLRARGIGDEIEEIKLPALNLVLVNPGIEVSTPDIFRNLTQFNSLPLPQLDNKITLSGMLHWLEATKNDLQKPAIGIAPAIQTVLNRLMENNACSFARMSGSGATCFGLFTSFEEAKATAYDIGHRNPDWWCVASKTTTARTKEVIHARN